MQEDAKIIELVGQLGAKRWSMIARELPGRIGKQCRERCGSSSHILACLVATSRSAPHFHCTAAMNQAVGSCFGLSGFACIMHGFRVQLFCAWSYRK